MRQDDGAGGVRAAWAAFGCRARGFFFTLYESWVPDSTICARNCLLCPQLPGPSQGIWQAWHRFIEPGSRRFGTRLDKYRVQPYTTEV